jgi:hypothetical protein
MFLTKFDTNPLFKKLMADPQSPVGQFVSGKGESGNNDKSLGSYESPSDSCSSVKRKRSSGA